jgi:hypothetical protein
VLRNAFSWGLARDAAEGLCNHAQKLRTGDNTTVTVVQFNWEVVPQEIAKKRGNIQRSNSLSSVSPSNSSAALAAPTPNAPKAPQSGETKKGTFFEPLDADEAPAAVTQPSAPGTPSSPAGRGRGRSSGAPPPPGAN